MAENNLTLQQQLALLPAAIPDSILDFLDDFSHPYAIQNPTTREAFDPEYLKASENQLMADLKKLRDEGGSLQTIAVEQAGRDVPGGFILKLSFKNFERGMGLLIKLKDRTIFRVIFVDGDFNGDVVREKLKNPNS